MLTTQPLGFDQTGRLLFMKDSRGRNTAAVVATNLETRQTTLLAEDGQADAQDVLTHPTEKHVQAISFVYERKRWQILIHRQPIRQNLSVQKCVLPVTLTLPRDLPAIRTARSH